jgi:hypothetical protein
MANASARRSFHGPLHTARRPAPKLQAPTPSRPLELVPAPPSASSIGRAVIQAARVETPTTSERERVLAGVLSALQLLTSANR